MIAMKKSQGLPMTTIVLIIIVLIVLAVVLIFFFTMFSKGGSNANQQQNLAKCQALCAQIESYSPADKNAVIAKASAVGFCTLTLNCGNFIGCNPGNLCTSAITCSGATPNCT